MFEQLPPFAPDPILAVIDAFKSDSRQIKLDLGVGVFKDRGGQTPVMESVKAAEALLIDSQNTKTYLGSGGNRNYAELLTEAIIGEQLVSELGGRLYAFQTVGGTGALRLGAELIAKAGTSRRIWLGTPTWANHPAVFSAAGLEIENYVYVHPGKQTVDYASLFTAAEEAKAGDAFLIHACCHNPTGIDATYSELGALIELLERRGVIPFVDCAYAGFAHGFERDVEFVRAALSRFDEAVVAFSCSKNFSLYRERVGLILVKSVTAEQSKNAALGLASIARANYSMPPDHGAASVATILQEPGLRAQWASELEDIRSQIERKRTRLASHRANHDVFASLPQQYGMFSLLPIGREVVTRLRDEFAIYMTADARINVLGVSDEMESYLIECVAKALI